MKCDDIWTVELNFFSTEGCVDHFKTNVERQGSTGKRLDFKEMKEGQPDQYTCDTDTDTDTETHRYTQKIY